MTFDTFKKLIPKLKKTPLPGADAHEQMAPDIRKKELERLDISKRNPRHAAVMMLCYPKNKETYLVLIQRPTYEGVHSAQIALPGGKAENEDRNLEATALRETEEEVGVPRNTVTVIQPLTKTYVPPSNFWVHPFMGFVDHRPNFVAQEEEVAAILEIPLADLLNNANQSSTVLSTSYAKEISVATFTLDNRMVWGATAMLLNEFKILIKYAMQH